MTMKIFSICVLVSGVFGSNSLFSFDKKGGSISALTTTCYDTSSCDSETITDDYIICNGYSSCQDSTISFSSYVAFGGMYAGWRSSISSSTDGGQAVCTGRWGCRDVTLTTNNGDIKCHGSVSCYSSLLTTSGGTADCKGEYACAYSDISASTTNCEGSESCIRANIVSSSELHVSGDNAGSNAYVSHTPTIYDSGENTFNGATISSNGTSTLYITSYGYKSTSEATVLCYDGATCNLDCLGDESCTDTTFYCENGATCETYCSSGCGTCVSIDYVDSIADELGSSLLLKSDKQDKQDFKPVIMENNVKLNNGISNNNNNNLITDGTLMLFGKILCFALVYEIIRKFVSSGCFSRSKKHKYQEIDDGSLRYTPESNKI